MNGEQDPRIAAILRQLMSQAQGQPGPQDAMQMELDAANAMGPEGMKQHIGLGTMQDRMGLGKEVYGQEADGYEGDMAQAQKLQAQRFGNSGSASGNILGGMGDVINSFRGGMLENGARSGRADALARYQKGQGGMLDSQDQARGGFASARLEAMRKFLGGQRPGGEVSLEIGTPTVVRRG